MGVKEHILSHIFRLEKIGDIGNCPTYLLRWILVKFGDYGAYLHKFIGDDWARDMHDHPKKFISIGLWGSYREITPNGIKDFHAPWIRSFPASHIHRVVLIDGKPCWTLVFTLKAVREWGFFGDEGWIHWRRYTSNDMTKKNCP